MDMQPNNDCVRLAVSQRHEAATVLASAFHHEPVWNMVIPHDQQRARVQVRFFVRLTDYTLRYGETYTTPTRVGVVGWLPPGQTSLALGRIVRSGLYVTPLIMGWTTYRRFAAYNHYADTLHKQYAPDPHWYLWYIGVAPASQGQGIGRRLLQPVLDKARAAGTACYLETSLERNTLFYEKFGFEVVHQGSIQGVTVWAMVRP